MNITYINKFFISVLLGLKDKRTLVYMDDIVAYSKALIEHSKKQIKIYIYLGNII